MSRVEELRLMARVARLYHEQKLTQPEISERLDLSQSKVSRLLKRAEAEGIVRVTVSAPPGAYPDLEEAIQARYGLKNVVVAGASSDDDESVLRELGSAAAHYVETTIRPGEVIGISSWSATLLAMVDALAPQPGRSGEGGARVVQVLGGVGNPSAEVHAVHLTRRLAALIRAEPTFLMAPGIVGRAETKRALLEDSTVQEAMAWFGRVTLALVGIGAVGPSRLLASSGNVFSGDELRTLQDHGAVGDVCLRFFDEAGRPVMTPLDDRVVGMTLEQLRGVRRAVGIAGGRRKLAAIRGALAGGWINVLITDSLTARHLVDDA